MGVSAGGTGPPPVVLGVDGPLVTAGALAGPEQAGQSGSDRAVMSATTYGRRRFFVSNIPRTPR